MTRLSPLQQQALRATLDRLTGLVPAMAAAPDAAADPSALVTALIARPWRRSAVDAATLADIAAKVAAAIADGRPLELAVPFGGYKGWRVPGAPHLDWAELFWVDYLRTYAARLAALHAPGVLVSLTCLRGVLDWVNNLRSADQDTYLAELSTLLDVRSCPRVRLRCVDLTAACGGPDAALAVMAAREEQAPPPSATQMASAARNLVRQGGHRDLGALSSDADWQQAIEQAARRCAVMEGLEPRRAFNKFGPRIQVTHIRGASLSLHLGSCRSGVAQPWVSAGHLEWRADAGEWLERLSGTPPAGVAPIPVDHAMSCLSPSLSHIHVAVSTP